MVRFNLAKTFKIALFIVLSLLVFENNLVAGKSCKYRAFNIKVFDEITTGELLSQLGLECNFSTLIKDEVAKAQINRKLAGINISNMSLQEIFDLLLKDNNLYYTFEDGILKISAISTKTFKIDYITSSRIGKAVLNASVQSSSSGTNSVADENKITSKESFNFWKDISNQILSVANTGSEIYMIRPPVINPSAGLITVTGTKQQLNRIKKYLDSIKKRLDKEVLIDVSIISVMLDKKHSSGIDWTQFALAVNNPTGENTENLSGTVPGTNTGIVVGNGGDLLHMSWNNAFNFSDTISFTMNGLMNFLKTQGRSKVVSNPKILTLNNQQALITIGDNINYRVPKSTPANTGGSITVTTYTNESLFVGILLNILPQISDNDEVMLRINPSISSFKYAEDNIKQSLPREIAPDTTEKKLSTVVRVKSGDTIILGGLIGKSNDVSKNGIPGLKELPILGNLFKSEKITHSISELIFVITPRIVNTKDHKNISLRQLGYDNVSEK